MVDRAFGPDRELAEAKVAWAADERRLRRRERELGATEATLRGLLTGLVRSDATVVLVTEGDRRSTGKVVELGHDCVIVELSERWVTMALAAVVAVEVPGTEAVATATPPVDDSPASSWEGRRINDVIAACVETREPLRLELRGGTRVEGEIVGCGEDLAVVRSGSTAGAATYVALDSVNEVWSSSMP